MPGTQGSLGPQLQPPRVVPPGRAQWPVQLLALDFVCFLGFVCVAGCVCRHGTGVGKGGREREKALNVDGHTHNPSAICPSCRGLGLTCIHVQHVLSSHWGQPDSKSVLLTASFSGLWSSQK